MQTEILCKKIFPIIHWQTCIKCHQLSGFEFGYLYVASDLSTLYVCGNCSDHNIDRADDMIMQELDNKRKKASGIHPDPPKKIYRAR
jgi:hypothetical protein